VKALLLFLFVIMPIVELVLLIWIGTHIGFWYTVLIIVATGILGAALAPMQGANAWRAITTAYQEGRVPGAELVAGALFLVGATFLITPGVITDALGLLLMVPAFRLAASRSVIGFFKRRARVFDSSRVTRVRRVD
jgi:UPF0716 protein FxsA